LKRIATITALLALFLGPSITLHAAESFSMAEIKKMAASQVNIEHLRKQKSPDWTAISQSYNALLPLVQETDTARQLDYQQEIAAAMKKCAGGDKVKVNQQTLAKGLQHIVVLKIHETLDRMSTSTDAAQRISAYFEGIRPTFTRRDKDYFDSRPTLEAAADKAIDALLKAGQTPALGARREFVDSIDRTYALSVLYEILAVEKLRDTDTATCEVKVKEAEIFYRIIQPRIQKARPQADETISRMLAGGYGQMNAALLEKTLNEGLKGITLR
jgi:hypothetical protein